MSRKISKKDSRKIEAALQEAKGDEDLYRRLQMVHLRTAHGMTQEEIAAATGVSRSTVNRAHMAWFAGGIKNLILQPRGGRRRENMGLEEESAFLKGFVHRAGAGELVCIQDIQAAYEKKIGKTTGPSTVYALLDRHGWRKLMPRPHHPRRDMEAQERFKKTSRG